MRSRFRQIFWYTRLRRILTSLFALALLTGAGIGAYALYTPDLHCDEGVARPEQGAECIGVSAGGYDFGIDGLREVTQAVGRENATLKSGEYATVALLLPLTSTDKGFATKVLHEVQGAYLAQYRANHDSNDRKPKIRLVLANTGKGSARWRTAVNQLLTMTDAPDRLRAVSGIATSNKEMKDAVAELTGHDIAVVGTTITADDLANDATTEPFPGLARVSPTNSDEADALTKFSRADPRKSILVEDKLKNDYYTATLKNAFTRLLKDQTRNEPQQFTSPDDPTEDGSTSNTFKRITTVLCDSSVESVFFAGRHTQLRQFVNELGERGCQDRAFTILTGDEASYLGDDDKLDHDALKRKVTVRYASLAHPDAWRPGGPAVIPATGGNPEDYRTFTDLLTLASGKDAGPIGPDGPASLTDGQAIIAYDAMTTAVAGIRDAAGDTGKIPEPVEVGRQWPQMKGSLRVNGASGWICLDNHGNPYNKAVPIVELTPEGAQRLVEIAWPKGHAPDRKCLPPAHP